MATSIEAQKHLISLLLGSPELHQEIRQRIYSEYLNDNPEFAPIRAIYNLILEEIDRKTFDLVVIADKLDVEVSYLHQYLQLDAKLESLDNYLEIIENDWLAIESKKILKKAYEDTNYDAVLQTEKALEALRQKIGNKNISDSHVSEVVKRHKAQSLIDKDIPLEQRVLKPNLVDLTKLIGGFYTGNFSVIAARAGMGKTTFLSQIREGWLDRGFPCASFVLEMSQERIIDRMIASQLGIPLRQVIELEFFGDEELEFQYYEYLAKIADWNWQIFGSEYRDFVKFERKVHELMDDEAYRWIDLDFLQLLWAKGHGNKNNELDHIAKTLAELTTTKWRTLDDRAGLHICAASQLSRAPEQRQDHRPLLSDLRDSGGVEQSPDLILGLYRKSYYEPETNDPTSVEGWVLKNRNGDTGVANMMWNEKTRTFHDPAYDDVEHLPF